MINAMDDDGLEIRNDRGRFFEVRWQRPGSPKPEPEPKSAVFALFQGRKSFVRFFSYLNAVPDASGIQMTVSIPSGCGIFTSRPSRCRYHSLHKQTRRLCFCVSARELKKKKENTRSGSARRLGTPSVPMSHSLYQLRWSTRSR